LALLLFQLIPSYAYMKTTGHVTGAVFLWEGCYYYGIGEAKRRRHRAYLAGSSIQPACFNST
jgi:hypothetical protein